MTVDEFVTKENINEIQIKKFILNKKQGFSSIAAHFLMADFFAKHGHNQLSFHIHDLHQEELPSLPFQRSD